MKLGAGWDASTQWVCGGLYEFASDQPASWRRAPRTPLTRCRVIALCGPWAYFGGIIQISTQLVPGLCQAAFLHTKSKGNLEFPPSRKLLSSATIGKYQSWGLKVVINWGVLRDLEEKWPNWFSTDSIVVSLCSLCKQMQEFPGGLVLAWNCQYQPIAFCRNPLTI